MPRKKLKKCSNNEAIIQNLPISTNMKTEICHADEEHYSDAFDESNFVPIDADEILGIKHESIDYEVETLIIPDAASVTSDFETSSISIKDEDIAKCIHSPVFIDIQEEVFDTDDEFDIQLPNYNNTKIFPESSSSDVSGAKNSVEMNPLAQRIIEVEGFKYFVCDTCGKSFNCVRNLKRHHKEVHLNTKDYICETCNKVFSRNQHLRIHKQRQHTTRNWKCEICVKFYASEEDLERHNRSHLKNLKKIKRAYKARGIRNLKLRKNGINSKKQPKNSKRK